MTPENPRLPLWRLLSGFAVLAILVLLLALAGQVYLNNFRLDRYMGNLVADPASAALPDSALKAAILRQAKDLDLPVPDFGVTVSRIDGKPHISIAKYGVQTYLVRMDLRMPEKSR